MGSGLTDPNLGWAPILGNLINCGKTQGPRRKGRLVALTALLALFGFCKPLWPVKCRHSLMSTDLSLVSDGCFVPLEHAGIMSG